MSKKRIRTFDDYSARLITARNPKSPVTEAYRTIRTNIEFSGIDTKIKTMVITSTLPNEGKSTVTANLGVSMATAGKKTLIIDGDLRNPTQHKIFNISTVLGLTNILMDDSLVLESMLTSPHPNLYVLTSGPLPPNPAELLGSERMRKFIYEMSLTFDMILIDTPPVLVVADAAITASYLDGVVLVAASGSATKERMVSAKDQLTKVKANLLGVILNKVPSGNGTYYYNYYYGSR